MKETVYIDTTIPSYYYDDRENLKVFSEITKKWWDSESVSYDIWISDIVLQELNTGNYPNKAEIIKLIQGIKILENRKDIEQVARVYIENFLMPKKILGDAIHLAFASFYSFDYLLTWNCNHLANANKRKHIRIINSRLGLSIPEIVTPMELFKEEENDY